MAKKPVDDSSPDGQTPDDTIELEQEPIMATAEFEALVELDAELFGDGEDPETAEAAAENDDLLSITDKLEKLRVIEDEADDDCPPIG